MPESPDEITIVAHFTARRTQEGELLNLLRDMVGPTRKEEGCLRYELNQEIDNPRCFALTERFRALADYDAHLASKHVRRFSERSADLVESRSVRVHRELLRPVERDAPILEYDDQHVIVIAHFTAEPDRAEELSALLQGLVEPTRAETGCLRYELSQDLHDLSTFSFVEMFANQQAFDFHRGQPYIRRLAEVLPALVDEQHVALHRRVV